MSEDINALTPQPSAGVPAVKNTLGRGHEEESDMSDLEIPRASLIQFTSEAAQAEDKSERIDPGTLINSMTKEELKKEFIPIFKFTNFIQWNPRKKDDPNFDMAFEPGAIVLSTTDRRDPRVVEGIKFGSNGEPPKVTKYLNFMCYFVDSPYPLILSFAKTSLKAGTRLNSLTQFSGGDMFSNKYKLSVKQQESNGTKYFVMDVAPAGKATAEEFKIAEQWFNDFRGKNIKVHSEEVSVDDNWSD